MMRITRCPSPVGLPLPLPLPLPPPPSTDWFLGLTSPLVPIDSIACLPSTSTTASQIPINQKRNRIQSTKENFVNSTNDSSLIQKEIGFRQGSQKFGNLNGNSVMLTPPNTPENALKIFSQTIDYKTVTQRPPYNYQQMIVMALKSSKFQKLTLSEIYQWTQENFAYYRQGNQSWKNSIRHNLSLNPIFEKIPKDGIGKNKGHYWALAGRGSFTNSDLIAASHSPKSVDFPEMTKSYMIERKRTFQNEDFMEICSKRPCTSLADSPKSSTTSSDPTLNEVNSPTLPEIVLTFSETGNQMIPSTSDASLPPQDEKHLHVDHLVDIERNDMWTDPPKEGIYDRDYVFPDNFDLLQEMDVDCYIPNEDHHWSQQPPHSLTPFNFPLGLNLNADLLDVYCSDL